MCVCVWVGVVRVLEGVGFACLERVVGWSFGFGALWFQLQDVGCRFESDSWAVGWESLRP